MTAHLASWSQVHGRRSPTRECAYTEVEAAEAKWHAEALSRCKWPRAPRLTDEERDELHQLLGIASAAYQRRVADQIAALRRDARTLGRRVASYEVTLADAQKRLEALASATDPLIPIPHVLVPYREASRVVRAAFARGFQGATR